MDKVHFDKEYFKSFTKGFFEEVKDSLTEKEIELLPFSAKLLTYECGIRFLTDYLNGDTYYKTKHKEHNLERTLAQFKLLTSMEDNFDKMQQIVSEAAAKN